MPGTAQTGAPVELRNSAGTEVGTASAPIRIDPTGSTPQTISGTVTANAGTNLNTSALALETGGNLAGAATSLAIIDDWDETDRAKVNPIVGQAGVQGGSGTVTATTQRVVLATDVNSPVQGAGAHDAALVGNPLRCGLRGVSADITAVTTGRTVDQVATLLGKAVVYPWALPGSTWNYAAAAGGLVNTTGVTAKAAAGAGIRNYITKVSIVNSHQSTSTEVVIRDGAAGTVLWRGWAQAAGGGQVELFDPPLRGSANTLVEIAEITATATAGVLVNLQGFMAAE